MVGNQYSYAAGLQVEDYFLQIGDGDGVDSRKGLVEQNERRLDAQAAGDLDTPAFAAGELVAAGLADMAEVELGR